MYALQNGRGSDHSIRLFQYLAGGERQSFGTIVSDTDDVDSHQKSLVAFLSLERTAATTALHRVWIFKRKPPFVEALVEINGRPV